MATDPPGDVKLTPIGGEPRTIREWLTMFHLVVVGVDPFTNESAWLVDTAGRLLTDYRAADCRVAFLVTGNPDEARQFLGPWADEVLVFADPDREFVKATGLERLPALVHLDLSGHVAGAAEGWNPSEWRPILQNLSRLMSWTQPSIPEPGDPAPYQGSPALV
jgi:hypothetical protein